MSNNANERRTAMSVGDAGIAVKGAVGAAPLAS